MRTSLPRSAKKQINYSEKHAYNPRATISTKNLKTNFPHTTQPMADEFTLNIDALVQSIPPFDGEKNKNIEFFLEQFDDFLTSTKIPANLHLFILKTKITGNAKEILINSPELREEKQYENLKTKLISIFKPQTSFAEVQNEFNKAKQLPTQSVADFAKHFNLCAQKYLAHSGHSSKLGAKDFLNTIKLSKFTEGLKPDIAFEVLKMGPNTYEETLKIAKTVEMALNNSKCKINTIQQENKSHLYEALIKSSEHQDAEIKSLKEELNSLKLDTSKLIPTQSKDTKFCHICEKNSHTTQNCFYNKKNNKHNSNTYTTPHAPFRPRFTNTNNNYSPRHSKNYWQKQRFPCYQNFNKPPTQTTYTPQQQIGLFPQNAPPMWTTPSIQTPYTYNTTPQPIQNNPLMQNTYFPNYMPQQNPYFQNNQNQQQINTQNQPTITFPNENRSQNNNRRNQRRNSHLN